MTGATKDPGAPDTSTSPAARRVLRLGGTITVIEEDHGSAYFHPDIGRAAAALACQAELQQRAVGDATIGRRLCARAASRATYRHRKRGNSCITGSLPAGSAQP
jgi:hypothetical protein